MRVRHSSQRGDTIVEVLISIAVIGAVLGGAYVVVNNSTKNSQAAQERSAAVKVAESQLELLRSFVAAGNPLPTGSFCLEASTKHTITSPLPATSNTGYPPQCLIDDGAVADRYVAGIQAGASNRFTVYVTWDGLSGSRSQVSIAYKVYP